MGAAEAVAVTPQGPPDPVLGLVPSTSPQSPHRLLLRELRLSTSQAAKSTLVKYQPLLLLRKCQHLLRLLSAKEISQSKYCAQDCLLQLLYETASHSLQEELQHRNKQGLPFSQREVVIIAVHLIKAVSFLQAHGYPYPGLNCKAVFLTAEGKVKLVDPLTTDFQHEAYLAPEETDKGPSEGSDPFRIGLVLLRILLFVSPATLYDRQGNFILASLQGLKGQAAQRAGPGLQVILSRTLCKKQERASLAQLQTRCRVLQQQYQVDDRSTVGLKFTHFGFNPQLRQVKRKRVDDEGKQNISPNEENSSIKVTESMSHYIPTDSPVKFNLPKVRPVSQQPAQVHSPPHQQNHINGFSHSRVIDKPYVPVRQVQQTQPCHKVPPRINTTLTLIKSIYPLQQKQTPPIPNILPVRNISSQPLSVRIPLVPSQPQTTPNLNNGYPGQQAQFSPHPNMQQSIPLTRLTHVKPIAHGLDSQNRFASDTRVPLIQSQVNYIPIKSQAVAPIIRVLPFVPVRRSVFNVVNLSPIRSDPNQQTQLQKKRMTSLPPMPVAKHIVKKTLAVSRLQPLPVVSRKQDTLNQVPQALEADSCDCSCLATLPSTVQASYNLDQPTGLPQQQDLVLSFGMVCGPSFVVQQFEDGSRYEGWQLNGMQHGKGRLSFPDESLYIGNWERGEMTGEGELLYPNGKLAYRGSWEQGKFHGLGQMFNDLPQPCQSFDCSDFGLLGEKWVSFKGRFQRGRKQGRGVLVLSSGEQLEGRFSEDEVSGKCEFRGREETLRGLWEQSILVEQFDDDVEFS